MLPFLLILYRNIDLEVSIIIVNFNTVELTSNCVESILDKTNGIEYEIIIVDNASTDASVKILQNKFKDKVNIISNNMNLGFGIANNIGVSLAKGEFVFLLNSDTIIHNNALKYFVDFYRNKSNLRIGVLGTILYNFDGTIGRSSSKFPTLLSIIKQTINGLILRLIFNKNSGFQQEEFNNRSFFEVDQVLGADMFLKREVFNEHMGFDSRFFMYFEETDLQRRIMKSSRQNYIIHGPIITHLEGGSNSSFTKYLIYYKSMWLYLKKHMWKK